MKIRDLEKNSKHDISHFDVTNLMEKLNEENKFLTMLVDTIPAIMYFDHDIQEKLTAEKHSVMNKAAEDLKRKSVNHPELSSKNKHKRARLDPLIQKSVSQIHQELNQVKGKKKKFKGMSNPSLSLARAANIEELQKRLQERILMFQAKRKAANSVEKKRLKNKVKKIKQNKGNLTKMKELEEKPKSLKKKAVTTIPKPVYNKEGKLMYSKFEFSENGIEAKAKNELSGKKYKKLLKKAEKKKEKVENLKSNDPEKAECLLEKEKWSKAIKKVEGVKIKDDPTLLKKSIKREEKKKKKSSKAWKERIEQTESKNKAKQEKRSKNIKARKQDKLEHKIKRAKKKGRVIPGF